MSGSFLDKDNSDTGNPEIPDLDDNNRDSDSLGDNQDHDVIAAILSYIPFLCLIPLLQMRDNKRARFHSKQGLILFLIELLALLFLIPVFSNTFWKTIIVIALGASVAGIIFSIQGKNYKLPLIGEIADKLKF